tara:strand:- start:650 stop:1159 length:510 start_codon:yes stop_codon:yes gene_type:complete
MDELSIDIRKQEIITALEDTSLGVNISDLGLTLEDLDNPEYIHEVKDVSIKENFAKAKNIVALYRYVAHSSSGYGSSNIGNNSRTFCSKLSKRTNVALMRYVDILKLNGSNKGFGQGGSNVYSVFKFRGGVNCKHIWVKYMFNKDTNQLIKAPSSEQPNQIGAGNLPNA